MSLIKTTIPERKDCYSNVAGLAAAPIPTVHIEIVGMGERGLKALKRLSNIPGVHIDSVRDTSPERQKQGELLLKTLNPACQGVQCQSSPTHLTYICTDWLSHTPLAVEAMRAGRHVAIEVPAAMTLSDIWQLVDTAEETRCHCMMLENCIYDYFEMATAEMANEGLFGEITHVEGGYGHPIGAKWTPWRLDMNCRQRGDVYPTHGMGPACRLLNIHRGDRLTQLVSMDTASFMGAEILTNYGNGCSTEFINGDQTTTLIRTQRGKTITLNHNVVSPRPYSRFYQIVGTRGYAQKEPTPIIIYTTADGCQHRVEGADCEAVIEEFLPRDILSWRQQGAKLDSRGGMAYHMDRRMIEHLQRGEPMDMDVYDMAEWCAVAPLSHLSIENGFAPVAFPYFIRDKESSL